MKQDVTYKLDEHLRVQITAAKDLILSYLHQAEIYLFGSIAKGCYSKTSDIDLLILLPDEMETKQIRSLRHQLEDRIEEAGLDRDIDLKLYSAHRYNQLKEKPCFEQVIWQDLINIENW